MKPIFKRFGDKYDFIRERAMRISLIFIDSSADIVTYLPYFFPAFMERIPAETYDPDTDLFIKNLELYEAYKRGRAIAKTDLMHVTIE